MKRWKVWSVLWLVPLFLVACNIQTPGWLQALQGGEQECVVRVGIIYSKSSSGLAQKKGYEMALEEINVDGVAIRDKGDTVRECRLEAVYVDDGADPNEAVKAVRELYEDERVWVIVGATSSSSTTPAVGVAEIYKVPFLVPTATNPLITEQGYKWVFRINAPSTGYAGAAIDFAQNLEQRASSIDVSTIAIIYENSIYGHTTAVAAATKAAEHNIQVVAYEVAEKGQDLGPMMMRVKAADADILFFAVSSAADTVDAKTLMEQCYHYGLNPKLYLSAGGDFTKPGFVKEGDEKNRYAEYTVAATQWTQDVDWSGAAQFVHKYRTAYNLSLGESVPLESAEAYAAMYVVQDALERAVELDADSVLRSLLATEKRRALSEDERQVVMESIRDAFVEADLETAFGPIKFDVTGQNAHEVLVMQVIDGTFVTVYPEYHLLAEYQDKAPVFPVPPWSER